MQRLQAGDDLALNEIMGRWKQPLASYLLRQLGNHEDALDLTMETFVRVYESRRRYSPSARFARWLFTIATNLARNHVRWKERHPEVTLETDEDETSSLDNLADDAPCAASNWKPRNARRRLKKRSPICRPTCEPRSYFSSMRAFLTPKLLQFKVARPRRSRPDYIGRDSIWSRN